MKRYAIATNAESRRQLEALLPGNYRIVHAFLGGSVPGRVSEEYVIEGTDDHGWTLDGYVIPRCASRLVYVTEIDLSHPIMKSVPLRCRKADFAYDEVEKGMAVLVLNDDGTPYKVGTVFSKTNPVTEEEKADPGLHQTIEVAFEKQIMGVSLWHLARPLSDDWNAERFDPGGPGIVFEDEQERAYELASADHTVPLATGAVMLLNEVLSHDMDMIHVLAPEADEEVVNIIRRTLAAELTEVS